MKELMNYISNHLNEFNELTLLEVLVLNRKMKITKIENSLDYQIEKTLFNLIDKYIGEKKMNPKYCAQIFHEYVLLKRSPEIPYQYLQEAINDPNQLVYLTSYAVFYILKGISKMTMNRKIYLGFAYQLSNLVENNLINYKIHQQCALFNYLCSLKLNLYTSHKKFPKALLVLKDSIEQNKKDLNEEDFTNIVEGFANAPHTLDVKLLLYVKNTTLNTISKSPLNLSIDFIIKFVNNMGRQREGLKLSTESLVLISNELYNRFNLMKRMKLSLMCDTIKGFMDTEHKPIQLYGLLYEKILETPSNEMTLNVLILIATYYLKQNYSVDLLIEKIYNEFKLEFQNRNLEGLLKVLYVYSHPNNKYTPLLKIAGDDIFNLTKEKFKLDADFGIKLLGKYYSAVRNSYFSSLQDIALEHIQGIWDGLSIYDQSKYALSLISGKSISNKWNVFLQSKFNKLNSNDLASFLTVYEHKENKNYYQSNFMFKCIIESPENHLVLRKIIDAVLSSPPSVVQNKRGTCNPLLLQIIDDLLNKPLEIDDKITHTDIIKLGRELCLYGFDIDFALIVGLELHKKINLLKSLNDKPFYIAEFLEMFIENIDNQLPKLRKKPEYINEMNELIHKGYEYFANFVAETKDLNILSYSLLLKISKIFKNFYKIDSSTKDLVALDRVMEMVINIKIMIDLHIILALYKNIRF